MTAAVDIRRTTTTLPCAADPEAWYDPDQEATAKAGCRTCPLRDSCLALAITSGEPWGVWGGYTEPERRRITAGRQPTTCAGCGYYCVPYQSNRNRCDRCNSDSTNNRHVDDDRHDIAVLAAEGLTDRQIAERLDWPLTKIKQCRARHSIPSCYRNGGSVRLDDSKLRPCGTPAAHRRHKRRGEPVDEVCKKAERLRTAEWEAQKAKKKAALAKGS